MEPNQAVDNLPHEGWSGVSMPEELSIGFNIRTEHLVHSRTESQWER